MWFWELNWGQLCVTQAPYLLYYLINPSNLNSSFIFLRIFSFAFHGDLARPMLNRAYKISFLPHSSSIYCIYSFQCVAFSLIWGDISGSLDLKFSDHKRYRVLFYVLLAIMAKYHFYKKISFYKYYFIKKCLFNTFYFGWLSLLLFLSILWVLDVGMLSNVYGEGMVSSRFLI